jgi:hypothetical protein
VTSTSPPRSTASPANELALPSASRILSSHAPRRPPRLARDDRLLGAALLRAAGPVRPVRRRARCRTHCRTPAAPTPAEPTAEPEQERDDGGFADPKIAEETAPAATSPAMTDPALIARVKQRFGEDCRPERSCGGLLGVDCKAAVDGPYYYVEQADLKVVSTCGGACMRGCTDCPPRAWACATY